LSAKSIATTLLRSYEGAVIYGGTADAEEALHNAINLAVSLQSDERKAELYARLADRFWEPGMFGVTRRIFVMEEIRRWDIDHVFGADIAKAKFAAIPYEGDINE